MQHKVTIHRGRDALSRILEEKPSEIEIGAFEEVKDPWYLKRIKEIRDKPTKYKSWRTADGLVYKQPVDALLGPITGETDTWKLIVPVEH